MPTGHYQHQRRVEYIKFACKVCDTQFEKTPGEVRQREERGGSPIQYCSWKCLKIGTPQKEKWVELLCAVCGNTFKRLKKRHSRLRLRREHCSPKCLKELRQRERAKWNDPAQISQYMRAYRKENWERLKPAARIHLINRRARIKGNGGTFTLEEWEALKAQYDCRCLACGKREPEINLTVDHVISIFNGGRNEIGNIQPLCLICNISKGTKNVDYRLSET
jgi:5-methylcytosine-specific restriction endonuclease McrA